VLKDLRSHIVILLIVNITGSMLIAIYESSFSWIVFGLLIVTLVLLLFYFMRFSIPIAKIKFKQIVAGVQLDTLCDVKVVENNHVIQINIPFLNTKVCLDVYERIK
jgi:presenilin-like A22 family membrane protease